MALGLGYGLPFAVKRPVQGFAEDVTLATNNALADAAQREEAGNCLAARAMQVMQDVQTQPSLLVVPQLYKAGVLYDQLPTTRTNFLPNNSMAGATGSVLPTTWASGAIPAGFTFSIGASGQATANDGTLVNYVDVSVSGTATASGAFNLFFSAATGAVTATTGQTYTLSAYATCISGDITTPAMVLQVQEVSGSTFQAGTSTNIDLASGAVLQRLSAIRTFNQSSVTAARGRIGHPIVSGTTYSYTIRIASPQLERLGIPTPMIDTSTGAVTRLNESTNVVGLPPDFTVTRATTATRVNSSGLIQSVASGVPRIDWLGQSCPGLLVEPSATNFARWVNQMTAQDTPTASGGMTITTGSTDFLAPDGTSGSITKYVGGAASGTTQYAYHTGGGIVATASGAHTYSLFVKRGATNPLTFCALGFENYVGGSGTIYSYFNLASGTALTAGASVQDYGNGWYRLISPPYTIASVDLTGTLSFFMAEGNGDLSWPASGALNLTAYTWGAQLETGSIATTYIPTTTGQATRAADVISASGALVSGLIGQSAGTIYAEVDVKQLVGAVAKTFIDIGVANNRIFIGFTSLANNTIRLQIDTSDGAARADIRSVVSSAGIIKIAAAYKSTDCALYVNGVSGTVTNNNSFTFSALSAISLGKTLSDTAFLNDRIRAAALYTTRLTDAQLAELTRL